MRHYEIVFLVHPDQSEQVPSMMDRYCDSIKQGGGVIHRKEDCGRRPLEYPIQKVFKAHYILMNIEVSAKGLADLKESFKFNDAIIRSLVVKKDKAITAQSILLKQAKKNKEEN